MTVADREVNARRQGLVPDDGLRRVAREPADPGGEGPAARLLPALGLGQDARPGADRGLPPPRDRGRRAALSASRRGAWSRPATGRGWRSSSTARSSRRSTSTSALWGAKSGTLWVDDLAFEEVSLVNVLRRPGCPFVVASEDGKTTYVEGRDFEPVADPKLGQVPYAGEYSFAHDGPTIRLKAGSRIKDGERLRVSWYHPSLVLSGYTACCLAEPKVYDLLRDQARRIEDLFHPRTVFMQHDELRVANWCRACRAKKHDRGPVARREREEVHRDPQGDEPEGPDRRLVRHVRPEPQRGQGAVLPRQRQP